MSLSSFRLHGVSTGYSLSFVASPDTTARSHLHVGHKASLDAPARGGDALEIFQLLLIAPLFILDESILRCRAAAAGKEEAFGCQCERVDKETEREREENEWERKVELKVCVAKR